MSNQVCLYRKAAFSIYLCSGIIERGRNEGPSVYYKYNICILYYLRFLNIETHNMYCMCIASVIVIKVFLLILSLNSQNVINVQSSFDALHINMQ